MCASCGLSANTIGTSSSWAEHRLQLHRGLSTGCASSSIHVLHGRLAVGVDDLLEHIHLDHLPRRHMGHTDTVEVDQLRVALLDRPGLDHVGLALGLGHRYLELARHSWVHTPTHLRCRFAVDADLQLLREASVADDHKVAATLGVRVNDALLALGGHEELNVRNSLSTRGPPLVEESVLTLVHRADLGLGRARHRQSGAAGHSLLLVHLADLVWSGSVVWRGGWTISTAKKGGEESQHGEPTRSSHNLRQNQVADVLLLLIRRHDGHDV